MSSFCECLKSNFCTCNPPVSGAVIEKCGLSNNYAEKLLRFLENKITGGQRTYGFEYEFISARPLDLDTMKRIYRFLPETGFIKNSNSFLHESGMYIDFEPGGQIEFHSPPLLSGSSDAFNRYIFLIEKTIDEIRAALDIEYIPAGYIPGREDSPLCLDAERYLNLHSRLLTSSTRGLEMMKGTASIHFHAGIMDIEELPWLFSRLAGIAEMEDFKMGKERRDIWDNTDPDRCGQPFKVDSRDTPLQLMEKIADHAVHAEHIGENRPFFKTGDLSFDAFMYHLTTIFTDIRINVKGPSIELRTIDSVPFDRFTSKWNKFITMLENNQQD